MQERIYTLPCRLVGRSVGRSVQKISRAFGGDGIRDVVFFFVVFFFFFFFFFFDRRSSQRPSPIFISKIPSAVNPVSRGGEGLWDLRAKREGSYPDRGNASYGSERLGCLYIIVQIYSFECFLKILKLRFLSFGT